MKNLGIIFDSHSKYIASLIALMPFLRINELILKYINLFIALSQLAPRLGPRQLPIVISVTLLPSLPCPLPYALPLPRLGTYAKISLCAKGSRYVDRLKGLCTRSLGLISRVSLSLYKYYYQQNYKGEKGYFLSIYYLIKQIYRQLAISLELQFYLGGIRGLLSLIERYKL